MLGETPQETRVLTLCTQKGLPPLWSIRAATTGATPGFPRQQKGCTDHWEVPGHLPQAHSAQWWGLPCPHLRLHCTPISSADFRGSCIFTGWDISELEAGFLCWVIKSGLPHVEVLREWQWGPLMSIPVASPYGGDRGWIPSMGAFLNYHILSVFLFSNSPRTF